MSTTEQVYLNRIDVRLSISSQDDDVSEVPEFMLAIHAADGTIFLAPYSTFLFGRLQPAVLTTNDAKPAEVVLDFVNAAVRFEGDNLETVFRLIQQHRLRRIRESSTRGPLGFAVRGVRCGPSEASQKASPRD